MATRTYIFTTTETAQFARLRALGFTRTDRLEGTEEASVFWCRETDGVDFTFFTEPYVDEDEDETRELYWHVKVHGKSSGGWPCVVCDHWLTLAEFDQITNPQNWSTVLSVSPEVRGSVALRAFLKTLEVVAAPKESPTPTHSKNIVPGGSDEP